MDSSVLDTCIPHFHYDKLGRFAFLNAEEYFAVENHREIDFTFDSSVLYVLSVPDIM